jgi:hypothetical protein
MPDARCWPFPTGLLGSDDQIGCLAFSPVDHIERRFT